MNFLRISEVYACIDKTLREDPVIRELMRFTDTTSDVEIALRIQKRMRPVNVVDFNMPMIAFYILPGRRGINHLEYEALFDFDIYTNDDIELAIDLADRINILFNEKFFQMEQGISFRSQFVTSAEKSTDLESIFKYFTQIEFSFCIEG